MDQFDLENEEKNVLGGIDRLLVNFGMAFIAIMPTYFYLIFKPKAMCYMLRGEEADGREGLKLGPGITFIFTIFVIMGVGYFLRDTTGTPIAADEIAPKRNGLRAAVSEGNFWRTILLSLPMYFGALYFGVLFHISHRVLRQTSNLTLAVGVGLYIVSIFLLFGIVGTGLVRSLIGDVGEDDGAVLFYALPAFFAILVILPWQTFSFSRHAFGNSRGDAAAVALISAIMMFISFACFGFIVSSGRS